MTGLFSPVSRTCSTPQVTLVEHAPYDADAAQIAFESELQEALALDSSRPRALTRAMEAAVLTGGGRIRPRLCLAVFDSITTGARADRELAVTAAAAVELMHCASLVHDDLPCFDDAAMRRGRPSVHKQFGEPMAILAGNALMMLALRWLARSLKPEAVNLVSLLGDAAAKTISGQAMESEPAPETLRYHRHKTGALFEFAVLASTRASRCSPKTAKHYLNLATALGDIYQLADDLSDTLRIGRPNLGEQKGFNDKPAGQDVAHRRPNLAHDLGIKAAQKRLNDLMDELLPQSVGETPAAPWKQFVQVLSQQIRPLLSATDAAKSWHQRTPHPSKIHGLYT